MKQMDAVADTPTRIRTRTAILQAAITALSQDPAASLGEIADTAGVARSTLHRYFPERTTLIAALPAYAEEQINAATSRARLDEGPAADGLLRLCNEYFDQWNTLMWAYMESLNDGADPSDFYEQLDPDVTALIERGQADGTIAPDVPNAWLQQMLWALLYSGWEYARQGSSKHEALTLTLSSLRRLTAPLTNGEPHAGRADANRTTVTGNSTASTLVDPPPDSTA